VLPGRQWEVLLVLMLVLVCFLPDWINMVIRIATAPLRICHEASATALHLGGGTP
jgi:hypothetical protein